MQVPSSGIVAGDGDISGRVNHFPPQYKAVAAMSSHHHDGMGDSLVSDVGGGKGGRECGGGFGSLSTSPVSEELVHCVLPVTGAKRKADSGIISGHGIIIQRGKIPRRPE